MAAPSEQPKKVTGGAFGQFLAEKRPELSQLPGIKGKPATAVVKEASIRFKALDETQRKKYEDKYEQAKLKYAKDIEAFLAAGGEKKAPKRKGDKDDKKAAKKAAKKNKDPDAPKKVVGGAFGCFLAKNRALFIKECAGQPITAITKLASTRWKTIDDKEKEVFEGEYQAKKDAFAEAMKSYVPPAGATGEPEPTKKEAKAAAKEAAKQAKDDAKTAKAEEKDKKKKPKVAKTVAKAKGKSAKTKKQEPAKLELQATVAAKAEKAGLTEKLLQLAARQDIIDSGATQSKMLQALEASGGLIHPAKRALLGA